ncbi:NAD(P)/FAD-dependent oxidoreductase [Nocardioides sp. dk4132]|uniref:NAD(P)/FAD-dependent oxidoreductase n=1 Tax=unclassified Nocardioides TaxID=2615069 RepID=UPI0012976EE4|nr:MULTISPECIES: FAD-dependent monooxygenase [unclassified Nocardioides]MQW77225.1 NAD(P)/FAD-dependent oxidoreductase [Nocardioides sp. dk4132]QGA07986.1 NAD(P)/FAD-dependent oxidoreductase [Nocardioides sp. dk884]
MSRTVDLLVAGGGPAGLATALHAARAGWQVEVWDPRRGAIDKACGEGLMPGALSALHALGVDPPGCELHGVRYAARGRVATADFRHGPGRGIRRTALHAELTRAALAAGVRLEHRAVGAVHQDEAEVRVEEVRARHLVAADGLHSPLRRRLGLTLPASRHARFGLRRHFAVAPWSPYVEVHWARHVEAYVTPVGHHLVSVAVLGASKAAYDTHLEAFPGLRRRLERAEPASQIRGAGPLRQGARRRVAGRVLLVGDAAGYVDALTGEGLALGFAQAEAAVAAMLAGDPQRYEQDWVRVTRRYRWLTAGLLAGTRLRPLRRAIVPAALALPRLFDGAVNELAR